MQLIGKAQCSLRFIVPLRHPLPEIQVCEIGRRGGGGGDNTQSEMKDSCGKEVREVSKGMEDFPSSSLQISTMYSLMSGTNLCM